MRKRIGEFLVEKGILTEKEVNEIVQHAQMTGLKFGQAGLDLGILKNEGVLKTATEKKGLPFFKLDPRYFPEVTRTVLPTALILKYGALPLGFKTNYHFFRKEKRLNIGFLNPKDAKLVDEVEKSCRDRLGPSVFTKTNVYLILADEFIETLKEVFHVDSDALRRCPTDQLDDTLLKFLESNNEP
jgi:hypothetical protein